MNFLILGNSYGGEGEGAVKKEPKIYFTGRMWPPSEKERSRIWKPPCRDLSTLADSLTSPTSTEHHQIFARTVKATQIIVALMATLDSCPGTGLCLWVFVSVCVYAFPSVWLSVYFCLSFFLFNCLSVCLCVFYLFLPVKGSTQYRWMRSWTSLCLTGIGLRRIQTCLVSGQSCEMPFWLICWFWVFGWMLTWPMCPCKNTWHFTILPLVGDCRSNQGRSNVRVRLVTDRQYKLGRSIERDLTENSN